MTKTELFYPALDDYLGLSETRFFGAGYRRAWYRITGLEVDPLGEGSAARAVVDIAYPHDWSTKADTDLRPHLSTVDMLVLGVQLSEAHLAHAFGLDADARSAAWLRKVTLRSGNKPQEDLDGLAATAVLKESGPAPDAPGLVDSVYDCSVGAMRARCVIRHGRGEDAGSAGRYPSLDALIGAEEERYFGAGFKNQRHAVGDVRVDMTTLTATAEVGIEPIDGAPTAGRGIDGDHQHSVSTIDCFVVNLQLAQVLMYELDSLTRRDSNTLWMLRTVLETTSAHRPYTGPAPARATITEKEIVPLRGGHWRNVQIEGEFGGVSLRCAFAHQLPDGRAQADDGFSRLDERLGGQR